MSMPAAFQFLRQLVERNLHAGDTVKYTPLR